MLNNFLRFIPAELLDDHLRATIRNPLFHTGILVGASMNDKWQWYTRYYDLLLQIILVALRYQGEYLSQIDFSVTTVPAAAQASHL